ncbi:MAG: hypothetical protein WD773_04025 [Gemmatimonadales bacterium]
MHEPAVVLTDLVLAILGAVLGWRLTGQGRVILGGLASAAFWGAVFHAFFPARTATTAGFIAWLLVAVSILVVAAGLLDLALTMLMARLTPGGSPGSTRARRAIVLGYCAVFLALLLFVDESFSMIVRLYAPILLLALAAAALEAIRARSRAWALVALGLTLSAAAALLQQARVALHPVYFDHNAVYHVVQAAALVVLYVGFHERRTDSAARAG